MDVLLGARVVAVRWEGARGIGGLLGGRGLCCWAGDKWTTRWGRAVLLGGNPSWERALLLGGRVVDCYVGEGHAARREAAS